MLSRGKHGSQCQLRGWRRVRKFIVSLNRRRHGSSQKGQFCIIKSRFPGPGSTPAGCGGDESTRVRRNVFAAGEVEGESIGPYPPKHASGRIPVGRVRRQSAGRCTGTSLVARAGSGPSVHTSIVKGLGGGPFRRSRSRFEAEQQILHHERGCRSECAAARGAGAPGLCVGGRDTREDETPWDLRRASLG